jgi:hypothetical protein
MTGGRGVSHQPHYILFHDAGLFYLLVCKTNRYMENSYQSPLQTPGSQSPLPNATAALVLGIIGILGCFCYGVPGLICAIIALVLANKDIRLYNANPSYYTPGSFANVKAGRICAIIALSLSCLYIICAIIVIAMFGFAILSNPQEIINQMR